MKKYLLLVLIFLGSITVWADVRTPDAAAVIAQQFVSGNRSWSVKRSVAKPMQLVYTVEQANSNPAAYVFSHGRGNGFVIVSADDACRPILGYTDRGEWNSSILPENMRHWLEHYADEIAVLQGNATYPVADVKREIAINGTRSDAMPSTLSAHVSAVLQTDTTSIEDSSIVIPLLGDIAWHQIQPYNSLCPLVPGDTTEHCVTGCVPTTIAQIMRFWRYPASGTGSHSYYWAFGGDTLSASFEHAYDWANMLPTYQPDVQYDPVQVTAVATLMADIGIASEAKYHAYNSSAYSAVGLSAMQTHFGYDKSMTCLPLDYMGKKAFETAIRAELRAGRPLYMSGVYSGEGHSFVCDGYDDTGLFHINWGWNGAFNGYFAFSALSPTHPGHEGADEKIGYNQYVMAYKNIFPDAGGEPTPPQIGSSMVACSYGSFSTDEVITVTVSNIHNYGIIDWQGDLMMGVIDGDSIVGTIGESITELSIPTSYYSRRSYAFTGVMPALSDGIYRIAPVYTAGGHLYYVTNSRVITVTLSNGRGMIAFPNEEHTELHYTSSDGRPVIPDEHSFDVAMEDNTCGLDSCGIIRFNGTLHKISDYAFAGLHIATITIPSTVTTIGSSIFAGSDLVAITIPDRMSNFGEDVFMQCDSLKYVVGPAECFCYSHIITQLYAPTHLQRIVINAGQLTQGELDAIRLSHRTLRTIDVSSAENSTLSDEAFSGCYNLDTLRLPASLQYVPYMAAADCQRLRSIRIPASVKEIGPSAFENCYSLQSVLFGNSDSSARCALRRIGAWAFYNAHLLEHLTLPEGVEEIGEGAFYGCLYLDSLHLPASVRMIGDNVFALCTKLRSMCIDAATPPDIASKTFLEVSRYIPVYVPMDAVAVYKAHALWSEFDIRGREMVTALPCVDDYRDKTPIKYIHNGLLYIRRGDNVYTLWGTQIQ